MHPFYLERLTMVQIAAPSRSRIPSYIELNRKVKETVERINQRYQTASVEAHPADRAAVQPRGGGSLVPRFAAVCLVTSLHDGMNLVAKEFIAAHDDEDGVLVLSKFTGAATELLDALIVNPYDIEGVATGHPSGPGDGP
jgi:trehalose-6-phosphate synthase